ncbi:MAG: Dam family site-specific DNA-(adenine-N6)-methyltransferase [Candidatus Nomurabacteria bacterium]|nr:Dam family site-specific DNA-(adenine-N6)-methyltransferase [Candidatus Nomurabacteria bacterium]
MKTPLNYTGNKSRLMDQFKSHFPKNVDVFVDLFCGGATVGLSVDAKKVIFIDNNVNVINLLRHLSKYDFDTLLSRLEILIEKYNLSYSAKYGYEKYRKELSKRDNNGFKEVNTIGYYQLRSDYNLIENKNSKEALDLLYLLVVYAFNNDMRFNKSGGFNLPVGKTDLNKNNIIKLKNYIDRVKKIDCIFICGDFREEKIQKILLEADFIYADPPYLIGHAVYNEMSNWTEETEKEFINLLEILSKNNKKFAVSNVLSKVGAYNKPLSDWILFNRLDLHLSVVDIDYHYRGASYNKINRNAKEREVLIKNF